MIQPNTLEVTILRIRVSKQKSENEEKQWKNNHRKATVNKQAAKAFQFSY